MVGAAFAVLALAASATASTGQEKIGVALTPAGNRAASATMLTKADITSKPAGWKVTAIKPDFTGSCPSYYRPKQSDLVVTGYTGLRFQHTSGLIITSRSAVLATDKMVQLDWQRTVLDRRAFGCVRTAMKKLFKADYVAMLEFRVPQIAPEARAIRVQSRGPGNQQMMLDMIMIGHGRTEIMLTAFARLDDVATIFPAEVRLARTMLSRVRA